MTAALKLAETTRAYHDLTEDDGYEIMDRLECLILDHEPLSGDEAAMMLEVVGTNLEAGGRSDGRDLDAVHRIIAYLRRPS